MVTVSYMASALVTGLLLLVVVVGMARWPDWRGAATGTGGAGAGANRTGEGAGVARGPAIAAIAALLLVVLVVALLAPGLAGSGAEAGAGAGEGASEGVPGGAAIVAVGAGLGVLTVTYLVWGVYHSTRYRGLTSAQAAGVGAWVFGLLVILGVLVLLLVG